MFDESQLEMIFRSEFSRLVGSLAAAAGSPDQAADAVQEAFIQAHLHWRRVGRYDDPVAWIRRVAVNRILNQRRSGRRRESAMARRGPGDEYVPHPLIGDLALASALAALPLRQRTAMALRFIADLSVADVARAMNISEGAVKSHVHRARERLALELGGTDEG